VVKVAPYCCDVEGVTVFVLWRSNGALAGEKSVPSPLCIIINGLMSYITNTETVKIDKEQKTKANKLMRFITNTELKSSHNQY
jgi:hypothetical protein